MIQLTTETNCNAIYLAGIEVFAAASDPSTVYRQVVISSRARFDSIKYFLLPLRQSLVDGVGLLERYPRRGILLLGLVASLHSWNNFKKCNEHCTSTSSFFHSLDYLYRCHASCWFQHSAIEVLGIRVLQCTGFSVGKYSNTIHMNKSLRTHLVLCRHQLPLTGFLQNPHGQQSGAALSPFL